MAKKYIPIFTGIKNKRDEKVVRKMFKRYAKTQMYNLKDPYQVSLMEKPRKGNGSYDGYTEYGLYELDEDQKSLSDQELEDMVYESFRIPFYNSPYDCTGKPFTAYISVHRNPCGLVSIIHRIEYDV